MKTVTALWNIIQHLGPSFWSLSFKSIWGQLQHSKLVGQPKEENDRRNDFMINFHESLWLGWDQTGPDPWISNVNDHLALCPFVYIHCLLTEDNSSILNTLASRRRRMTVEMISNYFMINLHESLGPGCDQTHDPWISSNSDLLLIALLV